MNPFLPRNFLYGNGTYARVPAFSAVMAISALAYFAAVGFRGSGKNEEIPANLTKYKSDDELETKHLDKSLSFIKFSRFLLIYSLLIMIRSDPDIMNSPVLYNAWISLIMRVARANNPMIELADIARSNRSTDPRTDRSDGSDNERSQNNGNNSNNLVDPSSNYSC